jgi:ABC-type antimicrobial peptide transport system permease subunit
MNNIITLYDLCLLGLLLGLAQGYCGYAFLTSFPPLEAQSLIFTQTELQISVNHYLTGELATIIVSFTIALVIVGFQSYIASRKNPVDSLKYE